MRIKLGELLAPQGEMVMKALEDVVLPAAQPAPPPPVGVALPPPVAEQVPGSNDAVERHGRLERTQRKVVPALEAVVDLLIEKGAFSREDDLAKVSRR